MSGFIYQWTNNINGKKYIGSHMGYKDDGYTGSGKLFLKAVKKYGIEKFKRIILEDVDTEDLIILLETEKKWLDKFDAANDRMFYNVAKDVIGGNTRAGWSDDRREEFRNQIKDVWVNRSDDEIKQITEKRKDTISKNPEEYLNKILAGQKNIPSSVRSERAKNANYPTEKRREAARLGKERMGEEKRKSSARKGVENRNPITERLAEEKRKLTRANRTKERKKQIFENMSRAKKGTNVGPKNGRARTVEIDGVVFTTLKAAMKELGVCEATLYKRLKSDKHPSWRHVK